MPVATPAEKAVEFIVKNIKKVPYLTFGPDEDPIVLCYRKRGEEVYPHGELSMVATEHGVFRRFARESAGETSFMFMRICSLSGDEIEDALLESFADMSPLELDTVPWQIMMQSLTVGDLTGRPRREAAHEDAPVARRF